MAKHRDLGAAFRVETPEDRAERIAYERELADYKLERRIEGAFNWIGVILVLLVLGAIGTACGLDGTFYTME